jgi:hypothetical protein
MSDRPDTLLNRNSLVGITLDGVSVGSDVCRAGRLPEFGRRCPWYAQRSCKTGVGRIARSLKQSLDIARVNRGSGTGHEVFYRCLGRPVLVTTSKKLRIEVRECVRVVVHPLDGVMRVDLNLGPVSAHPVDEHRNLTDLMLSEPSL